MQISFETKDLLKSAVTVGFGLTVGKFAAEMAKKFVEKRFRSKNETIIKKD